MINPSLMVPPSGASHLRSEFSLPRYLLATLAVLVAVATAGAQNSRFRTRGDHATLDTTVAFNARGTVVLTAGQGDIHVTGSSNNQLRVHATSDADNIRFDASSARATLEISSSRGSTDSRFDVTVPFGTKVEVRTQSGDISVRGTKGEVDAHTTSGDMRVEDVAGHLDVNSISGGIEGSAIVGDASLSMVSGDVQLSDVKGDLEVETVSGDITLHYVTAKAVRARTTSGEVRFEGTIDPAGRYEFTTHSGDVGLAIPREVSAELSIKTWNGTFDSEFPVTLKPGDHGVGAGTKSFTFNIGHGDARISAETFSGDITIRSGGRGAR